MVYPVFSVAVVVIVRMGSVLFPILCFLGKNLKKNKNKNKNQKTDAEILIYVICGLAQTKV